MRTTRPLAIALVCLLSTGGIHKAIGAENRTLRLDTGEKAAKGRLPDTLAMLKTDSGTMLVQKIDATNWKQLGTFTKDQKPLKVALGTAGNPSGYFDLSIEQPEAGGSLVGMLKSGEAGGGTTKVSWSAVGTLFVCGNHPQSPHLADGLTQMKELTKTEHCAGWKTLGAGTSLASAKLANVKDNASGAQP